MCRKMFHLIFFKWSKSYLCSDTTDNIHILCPCVPMCILSTLSALNSIKNDYYHIEFLMDSMNIGMQAATTLTFWVSAAALAS